MLKKGKVVFLLIMALVFALQCMPVAQAATVINELTAQSIFDDLGDALNYGAVAREWEQNAHAETSVCVDYMERRTNEEAFANSGNTYFHAMNYKLEVDISSPLSLQNMTFALYREGENGYVRCEGTEKTVTDAISNTTLTWDIGNDLKDTRLFVMQTDGDGYVEPESKNSVDMTVSYGPSLSNSSHNDNYIGKIIYHSKKGEGDKFAIFNTSDFYPGLVFGPETRAYGKNGDEYFVIDPDDKDLYVQRVLINYYYTPSSDFDPETSDESNLEMGYMLMDGMSFSNGVFTRDGNPIHVEYMEKGGYADKLVTNAEAISKKWGNMGGGEITSLTPNPEGGSTVHGPVTEDGYVVSLYDVEVGADGIFRVKEDMGWDGIPVASNEYVIINLICPSKDRKVIMGTDAADITYFHTAGQGRGEGVSWGSADSNSSQRVIFNFVYADDNGIMQPFEGAIKPTSRHGGTLLAPKAFVELEKNGEVHNGAIIADKIDNKQEIHQRSLASTTRKTWIKMNGGYLTLEKASLGYNWGVGEWQDMSANTNLSGAVFGVYDNDSCSENSLVTTITTDSEGKAESELIAAGTYWIKEITPLKDHNLETKVIEVEVKSGETVQAVGGGYFVENGRHYDGWQWVIDYKEVIPESKFVNQQNNGYVDLRIVKHDEFGNNLQGAKFGIYTRQQTGYFPRPTYSYTLISSATTNRNGVAILDQVPLSYQNVTYYIREIAAPDGYRMGSEEYIEIELSPDKRDQMITIDGNGNADGVAFTNTVIRGNMALKKVDAKTGANLEGAEFTVYSDHACTQVVGTMTTKRGGDADSKKIDNGKDLIPGTYYVKETKAPDGYLLPENPTVYTVVVKPDKMVDVATGNEINGPHEATGIGNTEAITFSGEKKWFDEGYSNNRPQEIRINLYKGADTNPYISLTVKQSDDWKFSFPPLPKYDEDGNEILYTIREDLSGRGNDYYSFITKEEKENGIVNVTVSNSIKRTKVTGTKVWEDSLQNVTRPDSITFLLYQRVDGELEPMLNPDGTTMSAIGGSWEKYRFEFKNLPNYNRNGEPAEYVVLEAESDDYYLVSSESKKDEQNQNENHFIFTLTNRLTVPLKGTKVWQDSSNADGKRPENVTLVVSCNGKKMEPQPEIEWDKETDTDNWQWRVIGLPKYDANGNLNTYTVKEERVPREYLSYTSEDGLTIYNFKPGSIRLYKIYVDQNGANRPLNGAEFKLYWDEACQIPASDTVYTTAQVSNTRNGFIEITNLIPGDYYIREEKAPEGFALPNPNKPIKVTVVAGQMSRVNGEHGVVINYPDSQSTTIAVNKAWAGDQDKLEARPESVTVQLYQNNAPMADRTLELTAANNWAGEFTKLPGKDANGNPYTYTVKEAAVVPGYLSTVTGSIDDGFTITNTYNYTSISVRKEWVGTAADEVLPEVTVQLKANDVDVADKTVVLNEGNSWTATFDQLPMKDENGNEITYSVEETTQLEGFTTTYSGDKTNGFVVTNSVDGGYITLKKVDGDNGNALSGAKFGIYSDAECQNLVAEMTTGNDGKATSTILRPNTYYVKEIQAPQNYQIGKKDAVAVTVVKDQTVTAQGDAANGDFTNVKRALVYLNKVGAERNQYGQFDVNTAKPLAGAEFTIYSDNNCTQVVTVLVTDENGYAEAALVPGKQYWLKETKAPMGYEILVTGAKDFWANLGDPQRLVLSYDQNINNAIVNAKVASGSITLTKVDAATHSPLAGAVFGVYSDSGCQDLVTTMPATNVSGVSSLDGLPLNVDYWVKEMEAPEGYQLSEQTYQFRLANNGDKLALNGGNAITNNKAEQAPGAIALTKVSAHDSNVKLTGAVFTVQQKVNGAWQLLSGTTTMTTDANGVAKMENLAPGEYRVIEATAPEGYAISGELADWKEITVQSGKITDVVTGAEITDAAKATAVTNTAVVEVKVTKKWDHGTNPSNKWPASVDVQLVIDGENQYNYPYVQELKDSNNWTYTWEDLPKYAYDDEAGEWYEIEYGVYEMDTLADYASKLTASAKNDFLITNTYIEKDQEIELTFPVTKVVEGGTTDELFTFRLEAKPSAPPAPMPEGAKLGDNGYNYVTVQTTGSAEGTTVNFPVIKVTSQQVMQDGYSAPYYITYGWNIYEVIPDPQNPSIIYDEGHYDITAAFQINEDGELIIAQREIWDEDYENIIGYEPEVSIYHYDAEWNMTEIPYNNGQFALPFTNTLESKSISVTKAWASGSSIDLTDKLTLHKLSGGAVSEALTVDKPTRDGETYTWSGLPKYELVNGEKVEITYIVKEAEMADFDVTYPSNKGYAENGETITNTRKTVSISGTKEWVDSNNEGNNRPYNVTLTVYKKSSTGGEAPLNTQPTVEWTKPEGSNTWTWTINGLEAADGVTYIVREQLPDEYVNDYVAVYPEGQDYAGNGDAIINKAVTNALVYKQWEGEEDDTSKRPTGEALKDLLTLYAYTDGQKADQAKKVDNPPVPTVESDGNCDTFTWQNLPKYDENGKKYTYIIKEEKELSAEFPYTVSYSNEKDDYALNGGVVYNTFFSPKAQLFAMKMLDNKLSSEQFTFELKDADDKVLQEKTNIIEDDPSSRYGRGYILFDDITYSVSDLGKSYTYTISEVAKDGYTCDNTVYYVTVSISEDGVVSTTYEKNDEGDALAFPANSMIFHNTTKVSVEITKQWVGTPGASAEMTLYRQLKDDDGALVGEREAVPESKYTLAIDKTDAQNWVYKWTNLEKNGTYALEDGDVYFDYVYTVEETVPAGYVVTYPTGKTYAENGDTIINTQETTEISVTKQWPTGDAGQDLTNSLKLYADGELVENVKPERSADGNVYTWKNLDKFRADGTTEVAYTVKEVSVAGYVTTYKLADGTEATYADNGGTIINTKETTEVSVTKQWPTDDAGQDLTNSLKLYADGVLVEDAKPERSADGNVYTWKNLDKFRADGTTEVAYTVKEVSVAGYVTTYKLADGTEATYADNGGTIINTKAETEAKIKVLKYLTLVGVDEIPEAEAKTFTFTLVSDNETDEGFEIVNDKVSVTMHGAGSTLTAEGEFALKFTKAGIYRFKVSEDKPATIPEGMVYSSYVEEYVLQVVEAADGSLSVQKPGFDIEFINYYGLSRLYFEKQWNDANSGVERPDDIALKLKYRTVKMNEENTKFIYGEWQEFAGYPNESKYPTNIEKNGNTWKIEINGLPAYMNGEGVHWMAVESTVPAGYTASYVNGDSHCEGITDAVGFSGTITNTAAVSATIEAGKTLFGKALKDGDFSFELLDADKKVLDTVTNKDGKVTFANVGSYTETGTHTFYVREKLPLDGEGNPLTKLNGMTYDSKLHQVDVIVCLEGDQLAVKVDYAPADDATLGTAPVFANKYEVSGAELKVDFTKELVNADKLADNDSHTFTFTLEAADGTTITKNITYTNASKPEQEATFELAFSEAGTFKYTVYESDACCGAITGDETKYEITVTVADDGNGQLTAEVTSITADGSEATAIAFENTYEVTSVSATKEWAGGSVYPESVEVQLYNTNGTEASDDDTAIGEAVTLNADNSWACTWDNLPMLDAEGKEISYRVDEVDVPAGYVKTVSSNKNSFTITNTLISGAVDELTITKAVEVIGDAVTAPAEDFTFAVERISAPDGAAAFDRKEVTLAAGGSETVPLTFDKAGDYTFIVAEVLPAERAPGYIYDETTYTVTYTVGLVGNELKVTNTVWQRNDADTTVTSADFVNQYGEVSVQLQATKKLEGAELKEGQFTFKLFNGTETVEKTNDANGLVTFDKITFYKEGEYSYFISEKLENIPDGYVYDDTSRSVVVKVEMVDGKLTATVDYAPSDDTTLGTMPEFVNKYETTEITVTKTWDDADNRDHKRPDSITIRLFANGIEVDSVTLTAKEENGVKVWPDTHTFTDLPKWHTNSEGVREPITYTVSEDAVTDYSTDTAVYDNLFAITNSYAPGTTKVTVNKSWSDNDNPDRPTEVEVQLLAGGQPEGAAVKLTAPDWSYTWSDLPAMANGVDIVYTVEEKIVPGYMSSVTGDATKGYTITNTLAEGDFELDLTKTLVNGDKLANGETREFTFNLYEYDNDVKGALVGSTTIELSNSSVENVKGTITFAMKYGTHYYLLEEEAGEDEDIVYDGKQYKIMVLALVDRMENGESYGELVAEDFTFTEIGGSDVRTPSFENTFVAGTTAQIEATKTLTGATLTDGQFSFALSADGKVLQTKQNAADGSIVFDPIAYDAVGEYTYTIEEVIPDPAADGYTYDDTKYTFTVKVTQDPDTKQLTATVDYGTEEGVVFTNTYTAEKTEVKVTKGWDDGDNADGLRPESITVKLLADGTEKATAELTAANNWAYTFAGLDKKANGVDIVYTVQEVKVDGYTTAITGDAVTGFEITNSRTVETTEVSVTKDWQDSNDQDGVRPDSITVKLLADGVEAESIELTEANQWTYTWTGLTKNKAGVAIKYTVEEVRTAEMDVYQTTITGNATDGFTIINTYAPDQTEVKVTKGWDDGDNADGLRPESITVKLLANGTEKATAELNKDNNWAYTFAELDKKANGVDIVYTVEEVSVTGYTTVITGDAVTGFEITNSRTVETTEVSVTKDWQDSNDQDGVRPDSITVKLLADGVEEESIELTEANQWTYTWTGLTKNKAGAAIKYTVEEVRTAEMDVYQTTIAGNATDGFTIINTYAPDQTEVKVTKGWDDGDNADGLRPESITVKLLADGTEKATAELNKDNNWAYTFAGLDKKANGVDIVYTVEEVSVTGYTTVITGDAVTGFEITNSRTVETTEVSVTKDWQDSNDQDGVRPDSITVKLLADGTEVESIELTEANQWTYTWTGLTKNKAGAAIKYTVEEVSVSGYTTEITGDAATGFVITNTYAPEKTSVQVTKAWDDGDNVDGLRPASITVKLLADGTEKATAELNDSNNWTYTFANLDKKANGVDIEYTVEEVKVDGYTTAITGDAENGFVITNSRETTKISVTVNKTWVDESNKLKKRPESITINLLADGTVIKTEKVTGTGDVWTYTFTDLPANKLVNGQSTPIAYTITEEPIANYEADIDGFNVTNTCTYKAEGALVLVGTKNLTGDVLQVAEKTFSFGIYKGDTKVADGYNKADGSIVFDAIQYKLDDIGASYVYTVKEIAGPAADDTYNYTYDNTIYTVNVSVSDGGDGKLVVTEEYAIGAATMDAITFTNKIEKKIGHIGLVKVDANDSEKLLSGAVFGVYSDEACTKWVGDIRTGDTGAGSLRNLAIGTYWVKETVAPDGYLLDETTTYEVEVLEGKTTMVNGLHVPNTKLARLELEKADRLNPDKKLPNAEYTVYTDEDCGDDDVYAVIVTGENGVGGIDGVPPGRYWIKETKAPEGYEIDPEAYPVDVPAGGDPEKPVFVQVTDFPLRGALTLTKTVVGVDNCTESFLFDIVLTIATDDPLVGSYEATLNGEKADPVTFAETENGVMATVSLKSGETMVIHGLRDGVTYTVTEQANPRYDVEVNGAEAVAATGSIKENAVSVVDYKNTLKVVGFTVEKVWQGTEGGEIELTLYANGVQVDPQPEYTKNGNLYTYADLVMTDETGKEILYTVKETAMAGYATTYENVAPNADKTDCAYDGGKIINQELTAFSVKKEWNGLAQGEKKPAITLTLYCNDKVYTTETPTPDANGWYTYTDLPTLVDGEEAVYYVKEEPLSGYTTEYLNKGDHAAATDRAYNGGTIVNSKIPQTGDGTPLALWMATMLLAAFGLVGLKANARKREI